MKSIKFRPLALLTIWIMGFFPGLALADAGDSLLAQGQTVYIRHCSACHGDRGDGASWAKSGLNPPPRNFMTPQAQAELSPERMLTSITHGRPGTAMMPFSSKLSAGEISAVVGYIRTQLMGIGRKPPTPLAAHTPPIGSVDIPINMPIDMKAPFANKLIGNARRGQQFYAQNCFVCHGLKGDGQGPRARVIQPKPRDFLTSDLKQQYNRPFLFQAIALGKRGTVMPAWNKVLNPQQIADVAEYVYKTFIMALPTPRQGLIQDPASTAPVVIQRAKALYEQHCYFCHGYRGDAQTVASRFMNPPPKNLHLPEVTAKSVAALTAVIKKGKPGTAMQGFGGRLKDADIKILVLYLKQNLAQGQVSIYHSPQNGWNNHSQYAAAFPFVTGQMTLDTPWEQLTPSLREGKHLYMASCVSCHDAGVSAAVGAPWELYASSYPRKHYSHREEVTVDTVTSASPYAVHEKPPPPKKLNPNEQRGEQLFQKNCAFCHAADGTGRNWIGSFIQPSPLNLTSAQAMANMTQSRMKNSIRYGVTGSAMPAWAAVLPEPDIDAIIAYIARVFFAPLQQRP